MPRNQRLIRLTLGWVRAILMSVLDAIAWMMEIEEEVELPFFTPPTTPPSPPRIDTPPPPTDLSVFGGTRFLEVWVPHPEPPQRGERRFPTYEEFKRSHEHSLRVILREDTEDPDVCYVAMIQHRDRQGWQRKTIAYRPTARYVKAQVLARAYRVRTGMGSIGDEILSLDTNKGVEDDP
jgi:hypothetical protein